MTPSLFQFATSELSQDAFFCWLVSWSEEKYKSINLNLYTRSRKFLERVLPDDIYDQNFVVDSIKVKKQYKGIDFLVIINNSVILLFEDKIGSQSHSSQLKRYTETLQSEFKEHKIIKIYLKTDYIWKAERRDVLKDGFELLDIVEISKLLVENSDNDIYDDFYKNIKSKLDSYESYSLVPKNKWVLNQWLGFFYDLSKDIKYVNFGKFHSGTKTNWFIISWKNDVLDKCHLSLEIFSGNLLIKAHIKENEIDKRKYKSQITPTLKEHLRSFNCKALNKTGKIMTLLSFPDFPIFDSNTHLIDYEKSLEKIKSITCEFEKFKL